MVDGGVMDGMFTIGEFSRMTGLSVKALRLYDEQSLLKPAHIDPVTSYRYYGTGQVATANVIWRLRSVEMPLQDIKSFLELADPGARVELLATHKRRLEQRGQALREAADRVMLIGTEKEVLMEYKVEETQLGDTPVLGIRMKTNLARIGEDSGRCFGAIYGYAGQAGLIPAGPPFILYFEMEVQEDFEIEVCAPVAGEGKGEGEIEYRVLPGGSFITTTHVGPYDEVGGAYQALFSHAKDKGLKVVMPAREVYLTDPTQVKSPAENVTQVLIPYE
jgi:effector-binding domain-containing protein